jgi:hypothetical protein
VFLQVFGNSPGVDYHPKSNLRYVFTVLHRTIDSYHIILFVSALVKEYLSPLPFWQDLEDPLYGFCWGAQLEATVVNQSQVQVSCRNYLP